MSAIPMGMRMNKKRAVYRLFQISSLAALLFAVLIFQFSCTGSGQPEELNIICLGDSITYGFKLSDPARESFPARLEEHSGGMWHVKNLGVNGATVLSRGDIPIIAQKAYQIAMQSTPDVVVLMLGTNDTKNYNWTHIDDFAADYGRIVASLQNLSSHPKVIACTIPPIFLQYDNGLNVQHVAWINSIIRTVARENGAEYLDVNRKLAAKSSLFIDGIHPNAMGAVEIASIIYPEILKITN